MLNHIAWGSPEKPAVVLLHGFMGCGMDWQPTVHYLVDNYFCLAPDLPAASFDQTSEQLSGWLAQLQLPAYHLVGYSLGGRIAMFHACRTAHKPCSLFIEAGHPGLTSPSDQNLRWASDSQWAARFREQPLQNVLSDWYRQPVFRDLSEEQRTRAIQLRLGTSGQKLADSLLVTSLAKQPDLRAELTRLSLPFAYCHGELDKKFAEIASELQRQIPTLHHITIPGAGHNCHQQQAKRFAEQLRAFLRCSTQ